MTRLDWAVLAAVCTALFAVCVWQAGRADRARDARDLVAGCEQLCRAAAADPY